MADAPTAVASGPAPQPWRPVGVAEVELGTALAARSPVAGRHPGDYEEVLVLARLHGRPVGTTTVASAALADPGHLAGALWDGLGPAIRRHAADAGIVVDGLGPAGLAPPPATHVTQTVLPTASVVIATRNRPDELAGCIAGLLAMDNLAREILVVENGEVDGRTEQMLQERFAGVPGLRYCHTDAQGISPARNLGVAEASGDIVVFTDDDVIIDRGWLGGLLRGFSPGVGCVTGLILPAELEAPPQLFLEQYGGFSKGFAERRFGAGRPDGESPLYPYVCGAFGSGASIAVRTEVFRRVGGFDTVLGNTIVGSEDIDLFARLILAGEEIVYQPAALVWHFHRRDLDGLKNQLRRYGVGLGALTAKWLVTPRSVLPIVRRLPAAARFMLDPGSPKNAGKGGGYPEELNGLELRAALSGPRAYFRSRRLDRRARATERTSPLVRNAYALMANSGATSVLGVLYWALAARLYSAEAVGLGATVVSTMLLVSGLAQLNLMGPLTRFIPVAGDRTRALVLWSYGASAGAALALSTVALLVARALAGPDSALRLPAAAALWFVVSVAVWCVFALQDSVLAGLRQAVWVPVENTAFGVVKIACLVACAPLSQRWGVFASFTVPTALSLLPMSWLIFRRLIPRHVSLAPHPSPCFGARAVIRFAGGDLLGNLFHQVNLTVLPLVVAAQLGATAAGSFYIAWVITIALDSLASSVATSLTVEGAHDEDGLSRLARAAVRRTAVVLVLPGLAVALLAEPVLRPFGDGYADGSAANVLRLLALSVVPGALLHVYAAVQRVRRRLGPVVAVQAAECLLTLGLAVQLTSDHGAAGVGWACLVARLAIAAVLAPVLAGIVGEGRSRAVVVATAAA